MEAVSLKSLPNRLAVIGGGPLGIEFAQMFSRLDVEVTVFDEATSILLGEEPELVETLTDTLLQEGLRIETAQPLSKFHRPTAASS